MNMNDYLQIYNYLQFAQFTITFLLDSFSFCGVVLVWQVGFPPRLPLKEVIGHTRGPPPSAAGLSWLGCGV